MKQYNHLVKLQIVVACLVLLFSFSASSDSYRYFFSSSEDCSRNRVCNKTFADVSNNPKSLPTKKFTSQPHPIHDNISFDIIYNAMHRELYIYGDQEQENHALVELVEINSFLYQNEINVRVTLSAGGVASGNTIIREFPLYMPAEAIPSDKKGSNAGPAPLIEEVYFNGGSQTNYFENLTDIPSWASGEDGDDTFIGGSSIDYFFGNSGNDRLEGRGGNDRLDGGFGSDVLRGGSGDDWLKVKATQNVADANLLCGGDGADHLIAAPGSIVNNDLHSELIGNEEDGYQDILEGYSSTGTSTHYFFNEFQDVVIQNGDLVDPDSYSYPVPAFIDCGA